MCHPAAHCIAQCEIKAYLSEKLWVFFWANKWRRGQLVICAILYLFYRFMIYCHSLIHIWPCVYGFTLLFLFCFLDWSAQDECRQFDMQAFKNKVFIHHDRAASQRSVRPRSLLLPLRSGQKLFTTLKNWRPLLLLHNADKTALIQNVSWRAYRFLHR